MLIFFLKCYSVLKKELINQVVYFDLQGEPYYHSTDIVWTFVFPSTVLLYTGTVGRWVTLVRSQVSLPSCSSLCWVRLEQMVFFENTWSQNYFFFIHCKIYMYIVTNWYICVYSEVFLSHHSLPTFGFLWKGFVIIHFLHVLPEIVFCTCKHIPACFFLFCN